MSRRFVRPPTVEEYARMTQALRLAAARDVADRLDAIEARRAQLDRKPTRPAVDYTAEEVYKLATLLLPDVERRWPDAPHIQAMRRQALEAADIAWNRAHPKPARKRVAA